MDTFTHNQQNISISKYSFGLNKYLITFQQVNEL